MNRTKSLTALKWIYGYTKKQLWWVVMLSFLTGAISLGFILLALFSKRVLDIVTGDVKGSFEMAVFMIFLTIILQGTFNVIYSNIIIRAYNRIDIRIKQGLFNNLLGKKWTEFKAFHSGEILNRFTNDVNVVVDGVVTIIPNAISLGTRLVAGLLVLIVINPKFTFIICFVGLMVAVAGKIYSKHFKYLHKMLQSAEGQVRSYIQECMENMVVIKSFSNDKVVCDNLYKYQMNYFKLAIKRNTVSNVANTGVYVLFTAGYYAALIWGALQIKNGLLTFGTLTAFLQIIDQIKSPMKNMSGLIPQFYSMIASAERVMELENLSDENGIIRKQSPNNIYKEIESIVFDNVTFSYENEEVLNSAGLKIDKGDVVAIAGPSGIGKSTMMKLMLSLVEQQKGEIYFNTTHGKIFMDKGTRGLFAYVPQGNMILSGTIRENIAFCNPESSTEAIINAAKKAMIWDFINTLPKGMETQVGERGLGLSEGQIQRIAIARAFLSDAPILLLDEATSALDENTEKALLDNIKKMRDKTCIFISHKERTINQCDKIYYMNNKKFQLTEFDELMKNWGRKQ